MVIVADKLVVVFGWLWENTYIKYMYMHVIHGTNWCISVIKVILMSTIASSQTHACTSLV